MWLYTSHHTIVVRNPHSSSSQWTAHFSGVRGSRVKDDEKESWNKNDNPQNSKSRQTLFHSLQHCDFGVFCVFFVVFFYFGSRFLAFCEREHSRTLFPLRTRLHVDLIEEYSLFMSLLPVQCNGLSLDAKGPRTNLAFLARQG